MAHVLVTGGAGFVGRHLIEALTRRGDRVRCLIRREAEALPGIECVIGDLTVPGTLERAVEGVEVVYHLAAATLPVREQIFHEVNADGCAHLAAARKAARLSCLRRPFTCLGYLS